MDLLGAIGCAVLRIAKDLTEDIQYKHALSSFSPHVHSGIKQLIRRDFVAIHPRTSGKRLCSKKNSHECRRDWKQYCTVLALDCDRDIVKIGDGVKESARVRCFGGIECTNYKSDIMSSLTGVLSDNNDIWSSRRIARTLLLHRIIHTPHTHELGVPDKNESQFCFCFFDPVALCAGSSLLGRFFS